MKNLVVVAGFLASLMLASNSYAVPVVYDPYGRVDSLVGGYDINSSCGLLKDCEEAAIEALLVGDYGETKIINTTGGAGWSYVNGNTNLVAFNLSAFGFLTDIAYFAVKIGNAADDFYVFKNNTELGYTLIDLSKITASTGNITRASLSHISTVPEPGSLLLIGVGALTAAAARRRQRSRQGQVVSPA